MERARQKKVKLKYLTILVTSLYLLFFTVGASYSQENDKAFLGVSPAYLEVVLEHPNDEKKVELTFNNNSAHAVALSIFPLDFKQKDDNGVISLLGQDAGSYSYSLSSFLSFESDSLTLDPYEKRIFTITAKNRQDLSPGGHYAAAVATIKNENTASEAAKLAPSLSSLILLRKVGGERFNLSLSDVNYPKGNIRFSYPRTIRLRYRNEGNVHMTPYGRIEIKDIFGRLIYKGAINTSSIKVFPESTRYIDVVMDKISYEWPITISSIDVNGRDSLNKTKQTFHESFIYINPLTLTVVIVLIGSIIFISVGKKKRKR